MREATRPVAAQASLRPWPLDDTMAQLVLLDVDMVPTRHDVATWLDDAADSVSSDVTVLRTGAMYRRSIAAFIDAGFHVADELTLLERPLIGAPPTVDRHRRPEHVRLGRLAERDLLEAARIDQASFPPGWRHDAASLGEIAAATPQARRRLARTGRRGAREAVGFSITGKAGTVGYLQRIAVHPDARRLGVAAALVDDALGWLMRRGAARCLVNTGTDNAAALAMYASLGFEVCDDDLVVLEYRFAP